MNHYATEPRYTASILFCNSLPTNTVQYIFNLPQIEVSSIIQHLVQHYQRQSTFVSTPRFPGAILEWRHHGRHLKIPNILYLFYCAYWFT